MIRNGWPAAGPKHSLRIVQEQVRDPNYRFQASLLERTRLDFPGHIERCDRQIRKLVALLTEDDYAHTENWKRNDGRPEFGDVYGEER